jgi:hypothetical protein
MFWSGYFATAAAFVAAVVGAVRWRRLSRGQKLATAWLTASVLADLAVYVLGPRWHDAQPVVQLWFVVSVVLGLEVLASLQADRRTSLIFRWIGIAYGLIWVVLAMKVESVHHYSTFAGPLQGMTLLGGGLAALLRRVTLGRRDLLEDPAFLVSIAMTAIGLVSTFQTLTAQLLLNQHGSFVTSYYTLNNIVSALGALLLLAAINLPAGRDRPSSA